MELIEWLYESYKNLASLFVNWVKDSYYGLNFILFLVNILLFVSSVFHAISIQPLPTLSPTGITVVPIEIVTPTLTSTGTSRPPATPTLTPVPTKTSVPTIEPTFTRTVPVPTKTSEPTPTKVPGEIYILQPGTPFDVPAGGCNSLSVAGVVFDEFGEYEVGVYVEVEGPDGFKVGAYTGSAVDFGLSGYQVHLGDEPFDSFGVYSVTILFDKDDVWLSDKIYFDTYEDCDRNVILINFVHVLSLPTVTPIPSGLSQGFASQYQSWITTQKTIEFNIAHGHLPPGIIGIYDAYVAVYHCFQVGLEMSIRPLGREFWDSAIVIDCSDQLANPWEALLFAPWPDGEGWIIELDALTAERWNVVGAGVEVQVKVG